MPTRALPAEPVIGIIGVGVVGGVMRRWFTERRPPRTPVRLYDALTGVGSPEEVAGADIVFVCVPTPRDPGVGFDERAVVDALGLLEGPAVVVIRSTVLPGTARRLGHRFPELRVVSNPEFLRERHAWADFLSPQLQVVGCDDPALASAILALLPEAAETRLVSHDEAAMIKLFVNAFLALKVTFANELYDLSRAAGVDYDVVRSVAGADPRVNASHLDVDQGIREFGRRGYSGGCLPKDVGALIDFAATLDVPFELMETTDRLNDRHEVRERATVANPDDPTEAA